MAKDSEWGRGRDDINKSKTSLFMESPAPPTHFCFSPVVVTVSVTNKEVQIKSTIFCMTLCVGLSGGGG